MKKLITILLCLSLTFGVLGCSSYRDFTDPSKDYGPYVKSLLDVTYKNDSSLYLEFVDDTEEAAQSYYDQAMEYWAEEVCDLLQVVLLTDEVYERMIQQMKTLFMASRYEVEDAVKTNDYYTVQVTITPIAFSDYVYQQVVDYAEDFSERSENGEFGNYQNDDTAYEVWETTYANGVMDIIDNFLQDVQYADPIERIVKVVFDEDGYFGISETDQNDLESYLIQ